MSIERQSISSESLKRVLIRYDFMGATSIDPWISDIKLKFCSKLFRDYHIGEHGQATIDIDKLSEISERLSIPLSEVKRQPLHLFSGSTFDGLYDIVELEITNFSITLVVDCRNYVSIEPYLAFINELVLSLLETDAFIHIERIGIRKIDGFQYDSWGDMEKNLNHFAIGPLYEMIDNTAFFREYNDSWYWDRFKSKINYKRKVRNVTMSEKCVYQALLDMDAYTDAETINFPGVINHEYLMDETHRLNDALFELFVNSITKSYISNHAK